MTLRRSVWLCAVGVVAAVASARAGEIDKYLPDDAEIVVSVNVRQIVDSDFFKKNVEEQARDALKNNADLDDALEDLGVDPFRDVDRLIAAMPSGGDQDRGLAIVHGRFDTDKFQAKAEKESKDNPDGVKIHSIADGAGGKFSVYEVVMGGRPPLFVALPNKSTLLASPGKDYVVDAMRKETVADKPALKNKEMQDLLEQMNDKQGVSVAMIGAALAQSLPDDLKSAFEKVEAVGGGVTFGDEIKIEAAVTAKDADDAKEVGEALKTDLKQARVLGSALDLAFKDDKQIEALLDLLNSIKVSIKDKAVVLKGAVSADTIDDLLKKDK